MRSPGPRPSTRCKRTLGGTPLSGLFSSRSKCRAHTRRSTATAGSAATPCWHALADHGVEQLIAVAANLDDIGVALGASFRQAPVLDPPAVAIVPVRMCYGAQPVGCSNGDRVQRSAQRLGQQLDPVQLPHGGEDVRAVGALPPARLEQPCLTRRVEHAGQQAFGGIAIQQAPAELA